MKICSTKFCTKNWKGPENDIFILRTSSLSYVADFANALFVNFNFYFIIRIVKNQRHGRKIRKNNILKIAKVRRFKIGYVMSEIK